MGRARTPDREKKIDYVAGHIVFFSAPMVVPDSSIRNRRATHTPPPLNAGLLFFFPWGFRTSVILDFFRRTTIKLIKSSLLEGVESRTHCPHTFSAFWLRSSVVSVLISLISDTGALAPFKINLIFVPLSRITKFIWPCDASDLGLAHPTERRWYLRVHPTN
jgi:hypothetical protein